MTDHLTRAQRILDATAEWRAGMMPTYAYQMICAANAPAMARAVVEMTEKEKR